MGRDGKATRDKILTESKALIYENGFAGTSVDLILEKTGITKGAFYYHFKTKAELAFVLVNDFATTDLQELDRVMEKTEQYAERPKQRLLEFVQCFIDMFSGQEEPPNCLYASVSNEQNQYSEEIKEAVAETIIKWRNAFEVMIDKVLETQTPKIEFDKVAMSDHFTVVMEGAFIVSKAINDPTVTAKQLTLYKNYLGLLFDEGN
ncbi:TetR/AcrR family transcriptional regulator [Algoriphagus sp. D3-2-R+10]|uniref:TetR/AcrR family transcriptional regulator n=1 Tax=Algoriphagus aurantiacus TaxID=3103948 RepID=UPI002B3F6AA1|nr:TetR/AcrR family transcriptional regulator [Algoriphagus sp. D3-2-R+10]MEB2777842.1 TetR/AcrR family transcriptional regulator [Algoriphagus sp. D3-2-R+10]